MELVAIFIFFKQMGFIITSLILILGPFFTFFHYIILVLKLLFFPKKNKVGLGSVDLYDTSR